jgi:ubiquinone/menaquinone biosynthesis C-methylase UbiE
LTSRPAYSSFAWAYDTTIEEATESRIHFITSMLRRRKLPSNAYIFDAGCGTGSYSIALGQKGLTVLGMDSSTELLEQAKQKLIFTRTPHVRFIHGNLLTEPSDIKVDAVLCRGVLGDILVKEDRQKVLEHLADILRASQGTLIMDVRNWETTRSCTELSWQRTYQTTRGELFFAQDISFATHLPQTLDVKETHKLKSSAEEQIASHTFQLYTWRPYELCQALAEAGFKDITLTGGYEEQSLPKTTQWLVAVATKRE